MKILDGLHKALLSGFSGLGVIHGYGINSQGAEVMGQVVPIVIHLMMNDYQRVWGEACYPVVD